MSFLLIYFWDQMHAVRARFTARVSCRRALRRRFTRSLPIPSLRLVTMHAWSLRQFLSILFVPTGTSPAYYRLKHGTRNTLVSRRRFVASEKKCRRKQTIYFTKLHRSQVS